jgi:nucleoporin SEH1
MSTMTSSEKDNANARVLTLTESSAQILSSLHSDYIHHVSFDNYGRRMATCSGDRIVRIWNLQGGSGNGNGAGNGSGIGGGGGFGHDGGGTPAAGTSTTIDGTSSPNATTGTSWVVAAQFQAHRGPVTHLSWSHAEFGTLVATCGSDYDVKVWEERGQHWVARTNLTDARKPVTRVEFAPRHLGLQLATTSADGTCRIYEAVDLQNLSQWPLQGSFQAFSGGGITCLSWCTGRFEPPTVVVGGSTHLAIWRYISSSRQWTQLMQFPKHPGPVLDVAWAPNVGRRFHWIAATEQGGPLRVYQLNRSGDEELELTSTQVLPSQGSWKCQWNVTGTVLASSGDAGIVQLWKSNPQGEWKCVSEVHGDLPSDAPGSGGGMSDDMMQG